MINITVVSGGRADWGLLSPVCRAIKNDPSFALRLVVTGQHLMKNANSMQAIKDDGFEIDAAIDMGLGLDDAAAAITQALGHGICAFAQEFETNRPDILLILGDRYEILGVVQAALIAKIPVAHLCGGDITQGAIDDSMRHAITKMSHLHFVTNKESAARVAQLGENPDHIYCVGNTGLDHIHIMDKMSRDEFFHSISFSPRTKNILVTFHPVTIESDSIKQCQVMLNALSKLDDVAIILTGSNADTQGQEITRMVKNFAGKTENACFHESLGSARYLNGLLHLDAVIGNSSSGLYEAPSFGLPTVNIGDRQKGRLQAPTVINCIPEEKPIFDAITTALNTPKTGDQNPYGDGHSAARIIGILKNINYGENLCQKVFVNRG